MVLKLLDRATYYGINYYLHIMEKAMSTEKCCTVLAVISYIESGLWKQLHRSALI